VEYVPLIAAGVPITITSGHPAVVAVADDVDEATDVDDGAEVAVEVVLVGGGEGGAAC
jgi:hypothetical protein